MKEISKKLVRVDFAKIRHPYIIRLDVIEDNNNQTATLDNEKKSIPVGGLEVKELMMKRYVL
jgi:hypothetical protein